MKEALRVAIEAAKKQKRPLDHILLNGPPGLGKTTLARIVAKEMGWKIKTTIGSSIRTANDVKAIAFSIPGKGQMFLFIDEVHRVGRQAQEVLYPILEDGIYYYKLGFDVTEIKLGPHTFVGATTNAGKLERPFVDRFGLQFQLEYYNEEELEKIISSSAYKLGLSLAPDTIWLIAARCRATPRIANNLLKRLRDYNVARGISLTRQNVSDILWKRFHLDSQGLGSLDRKVLRVLAGVVAPVGVETIAAAVSEDVDTIESSVEPYLLRLGLLERSARGRMITDAGRAHLNSI